MTFTQAQTRMNFHLGSADTTDPFVTQTDRDSVLNEVYLEYWARVLNVFDYTSDYVKTGNVFTVGLSSEGQWIELEQFEVKMGSLYVPLKRASFGECLLLAGSEGATGTPEQYGTALSSRSMTGAASGTSLFRVSVYPIPTASTTYRGRIKTHRTALSAGADVLAMKDFDADYVCRIAAGRVGAVIGYSAEWLQALLQPVPDKIQHEMNIDDYLRWSLTAAPRRTEDKNSGLPAV